MDTFFRHTAGAADVTRKRGPNPAPLLFLALLLAGTSCNDSWDNHFNPVLQGGEESPLTLKEYFEGEAGYSGFYAFFKEHGLDGELGKDQLLTVWAVKNENFDLSVAGNIDPELVARYHLNYLSLGKTELKNGMRIRSFNGIYLLVSQSGNDSFVNSVKILSTKKFKNGVVHEIESVLKPLTNMFDFIRLLEDDYSIIRDSIVSYNEKVFDKKNSIPIGVDNTGNTLYDSVFYTSNPLFEKADFSSEFNQFTLFLPGNDAIEGAFAKLQEQYALMGKVLTQQDTVLAISWIREAVFHEGEIADYGAVLDRVSPFRRIWRTTVQKIDESSMQRLSNGIVYRVTDLKIPNNVIISRIKSLVHYYEYLTPVEQQSLYQLRGVTESQIFKGDVSPVADFYYWLFEATGDPESGGEFSVEFTPLGYDAATGTASVMKVPPGEYNLYMGFRSKGHPFVDVYFHPGPDPLPVGLAPVATEIQAANSTPWNYDRVNETDPNISKWNGLGGLVGVVTIPGNEMSTFRIKVQFNKLESIGAAKKMQIYHWTLKPTANNY